MAARRSRRSSDGKGHVYVDIEDKDNVAVVDAKTMQVTAHYDFAEKAKTPAGLAFDAKNHVLFVACRNPQTMVILDAESGKILIELSLGDGAGGPHSGRSFQPRGHACGRGAHEGAIEGTGIQPQRARQQCRHFTEGQRRLPLGAIETPLEDWQHVFQVNFFAPIMLARGLLEELERAKGAVVNVTSIAGGRVHPFAGAAYATSKAALASLTREMAADFGQRGIRVNAISPGEIDTPILSPGTEKIVREHIPLGRLGEPEEVAKAIYFLCTDQSSYVNGAELHINGGQHV